MRHLFKNVSKQVENGRTIEVDYYENGTRWFLYVNGRELGMTFNKDLANDPIKWATKQLKSRYDTIIRNLQRLRDETVEWEQEKYELGL